jgi:hypothetical protein
VGVVDSALPVVESGRHGATTTARVGSLGVSVSALATGDAKRASVVAARAYGAACSVPKRDLRLDGRAQGSHSLHSPCPQ